MEPEGVVDVLRRLLAALVPGGIVVDLTMAPPDETVESDGEILGHLDGSAFFPRAIAAGAGLNELADDGLLALVREEPVTVIVRYPTGSDVLEDIADRRYTRMPIELAARLAAITTECLLYSNCLVRTFTKP
ncbi:MAG: hypothetical protein OEV29_03120 [Thermoleophilia bacterium]|nr:hypothetical protein [Thermoleophilia bacterium]